LFGNTGIIDIFYMVAYYKFYKERGTTNAYCDPRMRKNSPKLVAWLRIGYRDSTLVFAAAADKSQNFSEMERPSSLSFVPAVRVVWTYPLRYLSPPIQKPETLVYNGDPVWARSVSLADTPVIEYRTKSDRGETRRAFEVTLRSTKKTIVQSTNH